MTQPSLSLSLQPFGQPRRASAPKPGRLMLLQPTRISAEESEEFLTVSDLRQGANALAEEMGFDTARAQWEPASWYREAVDPRCSLEQAGLLREMTIEVCEQASVILKYQADQVLSTSRTRRNEILNGVALVVGMVVLLWAMPWILDAFGIGQ